MKKPWEKRWKIESDLSGGGQCINHIVSDKSGLLKGKFVLKRLKDNKTEERRKRFAREVFLTNLISHKGIPVIIDSNCIDPKLESRLFFVYRYIEGTTLESFVTQNITSLPNAISFIQLFIEIIKECHKNGIIHRDIKPDNIILESGDLLSPILIDFGLGVEINAASTAESEKMQLGNRFLRLPELTVNEGNKRDIRSDITATVGLLFFILTQRHPTMLVNEKGQMPHQTILFQQATSELSKDKKQKINSLFDKGFQNIINDRIQTFEHLEELLNQVQMDSIQNSSKNYLEVIKNSPTNSQIRSSESLIKCFPYFKKIFQELQLKLNELRDNLEIGIQGPSILHDQMRIFSNTIISYKFDKSITKWFQLNVNFNGHEFLLQVNASGGKSRVTDQDFTTVKRFQKLEELDDTLANKIFDFVIEKFGKTLELETGRSS